MILELTDEEVYTIAEALGCYYDHVVDADEAKMVAGLFNKVIQNRHYDLEAI